MSNQREQVSQFLSDQDAHTQEQPVSFSQEDDTLKLPVVAKAQQGRITPLALPTLKENTSVQHFSLLTPSKTGTYRKKRPRLILLTPEQREHVKSSPLFNPNEADSYTPTQQKRERPALTPRISDLVQAEIYQQSLHPELVEFDFNDESDDEESNAEKFYSIPTLVVTALAKQQGQQQEEMESEISGAAGGAAIIGVGNIVGSILKYGSTFLLQRGLGANLYGLHSIVFSLVWLIAPLFNLGLGDTMVRYIPLYRGKKQANSVAGLVTFGSLLSVAAGILALLLMFFGAPVFATMKHEPRIATLLQLMAFMSPFICTQLTWFGGLQGLKAFKWRVLAERILPPVILVLLLLASLLLYKKITLVDAGWVTIISTLSGTVCSMYFLFRTVSRVIKPKGRTYETREWFIFASLNLLTSLTEVFLESIDVLLLAFLAVPSVQIGQYYASVKISDFILMPLYSLNTMFAPTIAELHGKRERQKLEAMFQIVTKWTITFSLPIFFVATLFSTTLLSLSGNSFVAAWPVLLISSLGSIANASTGCVGYMLLMTGHQKLSFINAVTGVVLNITLGVILAPRYGALGIAIGAGLAVILGNGIRLIQVYFLLKIQPYRWHTLKPIAAGLLSAAATEALLYPFIHANVFIQLALIPIFLLLYIGCLALLKLSPEDKVVVDTLLNKFSRGKK